LLLYRGPVRFPAESAEHAQAAAPVPDEIGSTRNEVFVRVAFVGVREHGCLVDGLE
jgi:hypothetical protein